MQRTCAAYVRTSVRPVAMNAQNIRAHIVKNAPRPVIVVPKNAGAWRQHKASGGRRLLRFWWRMPGLPIVGRSTIALLQFWEMKMYELRVDGMTCTGCANSVKKAVQMVDRNAEVSVDLVSKTVNVKSDAALDAVKSAIDDAGYTVTGAADIH